MTTNHYEILYDGHVHLMSPDLISSWKELGIPFSKPDSYYSDIDSIFSQNPARFIDLIGMGYVFESQDYYSGTDRRQRLEKENDHLLNAFEKYPERIKPFIAIDPKSDYALDELRRCYAKSNKIGLKLHFNASQIYLTEPGHLNKVRPVFREASLKNIPILLHFDNGHPEFGKKDLEILADSILGLIPALDLRIAHLGTSGGFSQKTKNVLQTYTELINETRIPERHNIHFDLSAVALNRETEGIDKLTKEQFREVKDHLESIGANHFTFSTDYPIYTGPQYLWILQEKVNLSQTEIYNILQNVPSYVANKDSLN